MALLALYCLNCEKDLHCVTNVTIVKAWCNEDCFKQYREKSLVNRD